MVSFTTKLLAAAKKNQSLLCVGLDPDPEQMPIRDVAEFNKAIIEATHDLVCAYKPNIAFYEAFGPAGLEALRKTIESVPGHIPIIGDAKRGDIDSTARAYARAMFDVWNFDAVTVSPYLGRDSVEPFLARADKGVFVLCRTSNPGGRDFQELQVTSQYDRTTMPLFERVAMESAAWNDNDNVGLVVGATYPEELKRVRELCPETVILIPGVGAQGGSLELAVRNGVDAQGERALINSSRGVIYASKDPRTFAEAARREALRLRGRMNLELQQLQKA